MADDLLKGRDVIVEFIRMGDLIKVTAMDTESLTEIVVQGAPGAGEEAMKRNALRRLDYVLRKRGIIP